MYLKIKINQKRALEKLIKKQLEGINLHYINFKITNDSIVFENVLSDYQARTIKSWFGD